jgi:hypothetical protein
MALHPSWLQSAAAAAGWLQCAVLHHRHQHVRPWLLLLAVLLLPLAVKLGLQGHAHTMSMGIWQIAMQHMQQV